VTPRISRKPRITFATQPPCGSFFQPRDYNRRVRNYTTRRIKGGMQFTCIHCPHSVRTLDFDVKRGNLRTQAATALNQHAAHAHNQPMIISAPDVQQRIWRS
jgi:hypothetical protein